MLDSEIASPLEDEIRKLFGETSCRLERRPCHGKYAGHTDYTLVFGSGRRLYVGLDERNYLNSLWDHLRAIRYFRAHQAENSKKIQAVLAAHNTPFSSAEAAIVPYDGTKDLTLYAVVVLSTQSGRRLVYRTPSMHGCLVGYDAPYSAFESCMTQLLQDIRDGMKSIRFLNENCAA